MVFLNLGNFFLLWILRQVTSFFSVVFFPKLASNFPEQLGHGIAKFELVSSPVSSISSPGVSHAFSSTLPADKSHRFFARTGPSLGGGSPATKKVEQYSVHRVTVDGRCLFRALVKGMALNKDCVVSQWLFISQSTSIERVDGAQVSFPLRNMDLSSERAPEKENPGKS
ncbi:acetyl-coenzyme A carboxylase carboxyl transferase subunit alpha [Hibiscus syriacus]|uniref:Acetyl-coenzyme A carboxylase carboxyl transferase subunit alpha n=1 Tax=Hibiscus syriacus TaxID=106335 RepID=A0A6A3A128_HIBSY|nr:acetyl-coenzyme A carboxylase carboxyl transferase subunit alpha [Hibiscus syriacus]